MKSGSFGNVRRHKRLSVFVDSLITPGFVRAIGSRFFLFVFATACLRLSLAVSRLKHMLMDAH